MIDFRYHLVSILAIFLALTIGLVLGATALQDQVVRGLRSGNNDLHRANTDLRNDNTALKRQVAGEEQFAGALAPQIIADRLKDQSVVFVQTPGGNETIHGQLVKLVQGAGGHVSGEVTVQDKFLNEDQSTLDALTDTYVARVPGASGGDVFQRAGKVLAGALVTRDPAKRDREDQIGTEILSAYQGAGFITTSGKPGARATLAIMIAPTNPYQAKVADDQYKALISLAGGIDGNDLGTVLVGPLSAAQDGGLIKALRGSGTSDQVSSVDLADYPSGQTVSILALRVEMAGRSGAYGPGAGGSMPDPAPSSTTKGT